jgi:hypothetical protein
MSFLSQPISLIPVKPLRKIGEITVNVILNESTNDTLTITKQPVQQGASITDHAYKEPTVLSMSAYFQDNSFSVGAIFGGAGGLAKIYQDLLDLQESRVPFDVITPKRIYRQMLMATLGCTTDKNTENILAITMSFQEIIIVSVSTTTVPRIKQKRPGTTGATENAGKKSALLSIKEGIGALFNK